MSWLLLFVWALTNLIQLILAATVVLLLSLARLALVFYARPVWPERVTWLNKVFKPGFGPGLPRPDQAGLAAWPRLPRFFYPLASPAKAWLVAGLTSAFRPGFGPGLPRSGQAPDARAAASTFTWGFFHSALVKVSWEQFELMTWKGTWTRTFLITHFWY